MSPKRVVAPPEITIGKKKGNSPKKKRREISNNEDSYGDEESEESEEEEEEEEEEELEDLQFKPIAIDEEEPEPTQKQTPLND